MLKDELQNPMTISRIELYSTHSSQSTGDFYNCRILACETGVASLSTNFEANYDGNAPATVFEADTLSIDWSSSTPGWNGFDLDTPFQYSGDENLIVEFQYLGDNGFTVNVRAASISPQDRCLSGPHPMSTTGSLMSFLTCMRIHYSAEGLDGASFGEVKALFGIR